jgi:hypothetical protein
MPLTQIGLIVLAQELNSLECRAELHPPQRGKERFVTGSG